MKKNINYQNLILNFTSLLVILFPASLIAGPLVAEILMNLTSLILLFFILKEKKYFYFKNKPFYFFCGFCAYLFVRSIFSENPTLSFQTSIFYFRYGLFVIAILYIIENKKNFFRFFFWPSNNFLHITL